MAKSDEFDLVDRDSGILTKEDREYLLGEQTPPSDSADRHRRWRIRKNLRHALLDFIFLNRGLSQDDISKVFEEIEEWHNQRIVQLAPDADDDVEADDQEADAADVEDEKRGEEIPERPWMQRAWQEAVEFLFYSLIVQGLERHRLPVELIEGAVQEAIWAHGFLERGEYLQVPVTLNIDWEAAEIHDLDDLVERIEAGDLPDDEERLERWLMTLYNADRMGWEDAERIYRAQTDR